MAWRLAGYGPAASAVDVARRGRIGGGQALGQARAACELPGKALSSIAWIAQQPHGHSWAFARSVPWIMAQRLSGPRGRGASRLSPD